MKIAYFHTNTIRSSWTFWAAARTMRKLGHLVYDCAVPTDHNGRVIPRALGSKPPGFPTLAELRTCDRVIVCAAEYIDGWLRELYGLGWDSLRKWAIMVESTYRGLPDVSHSYTRSFWPDSTDVLVASDRQLPSFVDTEMFASNPGAAKTIDVGFMGTLYQKRMDFLAQVQTPIVCGQVSAYGMHGEAHEVWTRLYVDALHSMRIHVDLPSNNPMMTMRPLETMAAGTCLVTWCKLPEPLQAGYHYMRYTSPEHLDGILGGLLSRPDLVTQLARRGYNQVRFAFGAEQAWQQILT
jgi:hypothetical protein